MKYIKFYLLVSTFFSFTYVNAQVEIPPELIGSWLITDVYATDSSDVTDVNETNALMDDLVNNNDVLYEFTLTTFTLKINGQTIGSCGYTVDSSANFMFDSNGHTVVETANNLVGVGISPTTLMLRASPSDYNSVFKYHKTLTKQP